MKAKTWLLLFILATISLQLVTSQLVNGIDWSTCPTSSRPTPLARTASVAIPPSFVSQIRNIFPEGKTPNSLLVNPDNDAFIIIESASNVTFTFILEGADYRNQFGYFIFDPLTRNVNPNPGYVPIFPDVSTSSRMGANGCLFSGVTVTVGPFPATTIIGFWVRADGYSNPSNADTWASYTTDVLTNVDGCRHIAWTKINGQVVIGFEDLKGLGDMDYNDVMFYFTTDGNFTASPGLVEVVNGTLQGCVRNDLRISTSYQCTQFAILDASSSLACQGFIKVPDAWILAPNDATTRSAVLSNPSLFTNPDGSSICMVLADGTSVNNQWSPCFANTPPQVFSKDSTCYYVGCERKLLIKGMTSTSSCTGQRDLLCNPTVASSILSSSPDNFTASMSVFPQSWTIYLSDLLFGSASVNFSVTTLPQSSQRFDVMVLLDSNNMVSSDFDTVKNQIPNLLTSLSNKFARPPNVGFAIHTQLSASTYRLDILSRLTTDANQLSNAIRNVPSLATMTRFGNSQLIQSVQALASDNTVGWRGGNVFGTIIVVTVSSQQRDATLTANLKNALYGTGITPVYIVPEVNGGYNPYSEYNTFTNTTLKMGWSYQSSTFLWSSIALQGLDSYSTSIRFYPAPGDSFLFWSALPSPTTVSEACFASVCPFTGFTLTYPPTKPVGSFSFPLTASVNIPGVGAAQVNILSDRAPVVVDPFFVTNEDTKREFSLKDFASDEDGNSLRVTFLELPQGPIIVGDAYATLVNSYDISMAFSYTPPPNFFGQETALFRVTDGCKSSTIGTITFAVNSINDPPAAKGASFTINQGASVDVDLSTLISDVEDDTSSLVVFINTLPKNSTLSQLLTNQVVAVTQTDVAISTKVRLTPQASWFGNTSFTYYARDSAGQVSNVGIISVQVIPAVPVVPVNHQPICFNVVITGDESTTVTVDTIGGKDIDGSPISITLQSVVIVESYFLENITTDTGDITQNITIVGGELLMDEVSATLPMDVTSGSLLTFSPIPDINGEVATITYVVSDGVLLSEPCTATIFLIASNTSLSITSVNSDEFTLSEGSSFTIDFEQYIFSDGPTTVVLASLPTNGQLMTDSGVLAVGSSLGDNKTFTYVPDQYYNGNDNFDWYVIDNVNARADSSFNFIITLVNTPPSSANIVISTYRDSPVQISNFMVVDPDNKLADMALILLESTGFGTLSDKSKSAVSFPQTYSYGAWNFFWTAPADLPYFTSTQTVATYSFKLNDGIDDSPVYTITINLLYSNYPPTGADSVTVTSEDTPVKIVLQASDYESAPENLRLIIVSTAGNGNFYLDNAFSQLVVAGSQLPGKQIWFVPAPSAYSTDSPLATFSYFIVDEGSQISPVYKGSVYVNQSADLPRYSGALSFDVFEDGVLTMVFDDIAYANGTQATTVMTIVDGVSRGQLYECADNVDPCQKTVLISGSVVLNADKKLFFVPNPNDNGAAYTAFAFTLTNGDGVTKPYIVIINVIPVNDAPLITPGFPTMPDRVVFDEDTEYIFSWTVSDLDSPVSNISVKITSVVKNAKIFVCTSYADNKCEKGDEITPPVDVPYVTEGVWAVAYVPDPNAFDAHNFGWFNLVAEDDTGLRSPPIKTLIQVLPINDPPTIYAQYLSRSAYLDESGIPTVALYDIVIDDIDVGRNKLLMNITCTAGSNITIDHEGAFEDKTVNGRVIPAACTTITDDNGYDGVSCLESKEVINEILLKATRIQFETSYPSYQIYFTINDLGSTDKEDRPMESTLVLVASLESSLILIATNNTSDPTLTVTLSVSGGISVVVLILGIVLFSCKGNGDKIDTYFEGIAHSDPNGNKPNTEPVTETTIDGAGQGNRAALPVFGILVAAAAKKEKILYVPAVPADTTQPDYLATIDVDPMSPNYSKVIHRLPAPTAGDELRRLSWNVNTLKNRKYLIAPGMKSGNIHVIDTANPRAPSLHKTILGEDIMKSTGLTWPHAARCLPSGEILVSHMADKEGNAVGGFVSMTADFEVQGHWGKNSTQLGYSFAYQARTNAMISTGWGEPNAPKQAEGDAAPDRYGRSVWLWDMEKKEVLKSVDLGADGMMPLEVRFMHHPKSAHGFVCAALNGCVWHVYLDDNGEWQFERVIKIESISVEDWILPIMPALTTDLVISPDDKFLYISNWLHGDIRQYDITDPANPKLVSQLYLGGALRQDGGVKMTSGEEGTEVPMVKGRKLQGAPQSMQLSLDGTRLYVTNSFVSSWDMQFYPELESKGTQVLQVDVDAKDGGLKLNKEFLVDFADEPDGPAVAREMRLYEGDSTMDVCK